MALVAITIKFEILVMRRNLLKMAFRVMQMNVKLYSRTFPAENQDIRMSVTSESKIASWCERISVRFNQYPFLSVT